MLAANGYENLPETQRIGKPHLPMTSNERLGAPSLRDSRAIAVTMNRNVVG